MKVSSAVGADNVPEAIKRLSNLRQVDYMDSYTLATEVRDRSAEKWARAVLESTPLGRRARWLWQLLGLRLGPAGSPDHVQGWKIAERGSDWVRVETSSWFATAQAVCAVDNRGVSLALFLRYDHPIGALIWAPVSVMHQRAVPLLLGQALTRSRARRGPGSAPEAAGDAYRSGT